MRRFHFSFPLRCSYVVSDTQSSSLFSITQREKTQVLLDKYIREPTHAPFHCTKKLEILWWAGFVPCPVATLFGDWISVPRDAPAKNGSSFRPTLVCNFAKCSPHGLERRNHTEVRKTKRKRPKPECAFK